MYTVGLFGTCGKSTWRQKFIDYCSTLDVGCFNPQVAHWRPDNAKLEAEQLNRVNLVLFAVTSETYSTGRLNEIPLAVMNVMRSIKPRDLVVFIDQKLNPGLDVMRLYNESLKQRALIYNHLRFLDSHRVHLVASLDDMLNIMSCLIDMAQLRHDLNSYRLNSWGVEHAVV